MVSVKCPGSCLLAPHSLTNCTKILTIQWIYNSSYQQQPRLSCFVRAESRRDPPPAASWAPSELEVLEKSAWCWGDAGDRDDAAPCPGHFLHQAVSAVVAWLARWKWICIEPLWCNENIWQIFSHIWTLLLLKCVFLLGTLFSKIKL